MCKTVFSNEITKIELKQKISDQDISVGLNAQVKITAVKSFIIQDPGCAKLSLVMKDVKLNINSKHQTKISGLAIKDVIVQIPAVKSFDLGCVKLCLVMKDISLN